MQDAEIDKLVEGAARAIVDVHPMIPGPGSLKEPAEALIEAAKKGYLLPDEDDQVRGIFAKYLTTRAVLKTNLMDLKPAVIHELSQPEMRHPELFIVAFCSACLLIRSARFVIETFRKEPVIWRKLDEAEPRFGIPHRRFTKIYRSLTSPQNLWVFLDAVQYWQQNRERLLELSDNEDLAPVLEILKEEEKFINDSRRYHAMGRLKYRLHSLIRRHKSGYRNVMFALFKVSGKVIAEMRLKWKTKRVSPQVQSRIAQILRPGDVLITRHDDAASNLFLPGYWPHGALHIGSASEREELAVEMTEDRKRRSEGEIRILEARKDGVLFRELADTLSVDEVVIVRPKLSESEIKEGLSRAIAHEGKSYDFEFDFRRTNKLVCTEVVYRAFHGIGEIDFQLTTRAGRYCLSAEDILDHSVEERGFTVVALFGFGGDLFYEGDEARAVLVESYRNKE